MRVMREARRFNVVACGRRWGKSTMGEDRLIGPALEGRPVAWFAPTYKESEEPWRDLKRILAPAVARKNEQTRRLELVTGGIVDLWSLDNYDAVRGRKYARAVVDEAAKVKNLEDAWNAVIRPTLVDFAGDAYLLSTPRGRNFFAACFARGEDPAEPDWASWRMPTITNPHVPASEVEALRRQLPERTYRQEILAEFLDDAGGVFRGVSEAVDAGRTQNLEPEQGRIHTLGVDLARVEDFTVLAVVDQDGRQCHHERFNQVSWERQIEAIVRVARKFRARVYVDSTGVGDPIFERLRQAGLNVQGYQLTSQSKEALIDNLAMLIEQGRARLMDVPVQTNELKAYEYQMTPSRNVRMSAPEGMHDDCVIALALAFWGLSRRRGHGVLL